MPSWLDSSQIYLPNPSPLRGGLTTGVHSIRRQQNKKSKQKAPAREILTATQVSLRIEESCKHVILCRRNTYFL